MNHQGLTLEERAVAKGLDPVEVTERAAIMEFDGGLPRWQAERYALGDWTPETEHTRRPNTQLRTAEF